MAQTSFALMTTLGRAKEAAALANATTIEITHIAIGDGTTVPSGGETALYHEVARKTISAHGTVVGAVNVAYFDCYLAAADGPYTIREAGLYDDDGDLIAIAHYDPPISKPTPDSGQTVEGTVRLEVAFSDVANVTIKVDPSMLVALQRLTRLPWIPIIELGRNSPPATPAIGDVYVVGVSPTGSWAGQAGKVAEYTSAGWAIAIPPDGHGVCVPDGRLFVRRGGSYTEFAASLTARGLVELATQVETREGADAERAVTPAGLWVAMRSGWWAIAAGTGNDITASLTPPLTSYSAGLVIALEITSDNTGAVTLNVDGLGAKSVRNVSQNLLLGAGALKDNHVAFLVYDGGKFVCLNPIATDIGRGLVELATNSEATAGADTERAVTPSAAMALLGSRLRGAANTAPVPAGGWNDATSWGFFPVLLPGNAMGGPGGIDLFHVFNVWYGPDDQNMTQIAIPYGDTNSQKRGFLERGRYQGAWKGWLPIVREATEALAGIVRRATVQEVTTAAAVNAYIGPEALAAALETHRAKIAADLSWPGSTFQTIDWNDYAAAPGFATESGGVYTLTRGGTYLVIAQIAHDCPNASSINIYWKKLGAGSALLVASNSQTTGGSANNALSVAYVLPGNEVSIGDQIDIRAYLGATGKHINKETAPGMPTSVSISRIGN